MTTADPFVIFFFCDEHSQGAFVRDILVQEIAKVGFLGSYMYLCL